MTERKIYADFLLKAIETSSISIYTKRQIVERLKELEIEYLRRRVEETEPT